MAIAAQSKQGIEAKNDLDAFYWAMCGTLVALNNA